MSAPDEQRYRCPECRHPWKLHDRYGCTQSNGPLADGSGSDDCTCQRQVPAGNRD